MYRRKYLLLKSILRNFYDLSYKPYGFKFYTTFHFVMLFVIILAGVLFYKPYSRNKKFKVILHVVPITLELIRLALVYNTEYYMVSYLPFHLCIWGTYFLVLDLVFVDSKFIKSCLFYLFMTGAILALIFPDWGLLNKYSYVSMISWIIHAILVFIPIYMILNGEYKPKFLDIKYPLIFIIAILPLIKYLNSRFDANFFYINEPSHGSPLEIIYKYAPNYILTLMLITAVVMALVYLVYRLINLVLTRGK